MVRVSTPASMRLAVAASAASMRMRMVWPAKPVMLADAVVQAPARLVAAPAWLSTTELVEPTTVTRKKSALVALLRWARYQANDSVSVPVAGRVIVGDWMLVVP